MNQLSKGGGTGGVSKGTTLGHKERSTGNLANEEGSFVLSA